MLRIRFLNVGQGDSIILEWQDITDLSWKIGIIDCNLYLNANPTLSYLIQNNYKEIEFILLSHPHSDHFSGMKALLLHCEKNQISIKYFFHTSEQVPAYLKAACKSVTEQNELFELYKTVFRLYKSNLLEKQTLKQLFTPHNFNRKY
jgi:competence protein ComEC